MEQQRYCYETVDHPCKDQDCPILNGEIVPKEIVPFRVPIAFNRLFAVCYFCETTASVRPATDEEIVADGQYMEP